RFGERVDAAVELAEDVFERVPDVEAGVGRAGARVEEAAEGHGRFVEAVELAQALADVDQERRRRVRGVARLEFAERGGGVARGGSGATAAAAAAAYTGWAWRPAVAGTACFLSLSLASAGLSGSGRVGCSSRGEGAIVVGTCGCIIIGSVGDGRASSSGRGGTQMGCVSSRRGAGGLIGLGAGVRG